jgi:hypothetical protein
LWSECFTWKGFRKRSRMAKSRWQGLGGKSRELTYSDLDKIRTAISDFFWPFFRKFRIFPDPPKNSPNFIGISSLYVYKAIDDIDDIDEKVRIFPGPKSGLFKKSETFRSEFYLGHCNWKSIQSFDFFSKKWFGFRIGIPNFI